MFFFISSIDGAFLIKHSSPLHRGMVNDIIANPTTMLKIISNLDVLSTANILLLVYGKK